MNKKRSCALALALLLCVSLCGCGAAQKNSQSVRQENAPYPAPMEAPAAMMNAAYDMEAAYEESGFGMTRGAAKSGGTKSDDTPAENPEKIIYSGEATVETTEFENTIAALEQMIEKEGGFIESSSVNGSNYYDSARGYTSRRTASYTLRVPSERFSDIMSKLSSFGNVPYTYTYTENVTAQYYDTQARLQALEAQETRLVEMMKLAETVEDIITIEDKLTDVRYRIDSLQSNLKNWDRRVAYSTLNITVKEVQVYTPEKVTKITYGEELWRAFTGALANAGQFFKDLLVFLVSAIPTLVILAALFFIFRPLLRKLSAKLKGRRASRRAKKGETVQDAGIEK